MQRHVLDRLPLYGDAHNPYLTRYGAPLPIASDYVEGLGLAVHEHGKRCHRLRMGQQDELPSARSNMLIDPPGVASAVRYCYHLAVCEPDFEIACKKKGLG